MSVAKVPFCDPIPRTRMPWGWLLGFGLILVLLAGCGGRSNSPATRATTGRATITVRWPERSRLIPIAANSIRVTLTQETRQIAETVLARPTTGNTATADFTNLPLGALNVTAQAHPDTNGTGVAQAVGTTTMMVEPEQTAAITVTMDSTIDRIEIGPSGDSFAPLNGTRTLTATAYNTAGEIVLAPATLEWSVSDATIATVNASGEMRGLKRGGVTLTVRETESGKTASRAMTVIGASVETITYNGWANSLRLENGTVELVIVPSVCRIMFYGYVGGANILWDDPRYYGTIGNGTEGFNWRNVGGDKIWPWPQDFWGWPPPAAADVLPYTSEIVGPDTVRITSQRVDPWGVRVVRDITLAPTGSRVTVISKLIKESGAASPAVTPWAVTQVPATDWVIARLLPSADDLTDGYRSMGASFRSISRALDGMLLVEREPGRASKLGTDADILASLQGDTLFTVRLNNPPPADNAFFPYIGGEMAQIYAHDQNTYIELEMTAPLKVLQTGQTITLAQTWELQRLPDAERNPAGVAAFLRGLP